MKRAALLSFALLLGCPDGDGPPEEATTPAETLSPEPAGAPLEVADGRLNCLGKGGAPAAEGSVLELTGYVRTLADPEGKAPPPAAKVTAYTPEGASLGEGFADPAKSGRVSISVPVTPAGFVGYAEATFAGYVDWRLQSTRAVTDTERTGWAWLATPAEVAERATKLGLATTDGTGILVGSVHDCDGFGTQSALIQVDGVTSGVLYVEGFDVASTRTFTSEAGRFVVPNLAPGPVVVKAFGRLAAGGPLTLLSSMVATVAAGKMTAVELTPRGK